jgi:hypothetical protein
MEMALPTLADGERYARWVESRPAFSGMRISIYPVDTQVWTGLARSGCPSTGWWAVRAVFNWRCGPLQSSRFW